MDKSELKLKRLGSDVAALEAKLTICRAETETLRAELNESRTALARAEARALQAESARDDVVTTSVIDANKRAGDLEAQRDAVAGELEEMRSSFEVATEERIRALGRITIFKDKIANIEIGSV